MSDINLELDSFIRKSGFKVSEFMISQRTNKKINLEDSPKKKKSKKKKNGKKSKRVVVFNMGLNEVNNIDRNLIPDNNLSLIQDNIISLITINNQ